MVNGANLAPTYLSIFSDLVLVSRMIKARIWNKEVLINNLSQIFYNMLQEQEYI